MTRRLLILSVSALLLTGLLVTGCGSTNSAQTNTTPTVSTPAEPTVDLFTKRACRKWYESISEGSKGVQTTAEIRKGLQVVYEAAQFSEIPAIVDAGTRQLAAITIEDVDAFQAAMTDFGNACKAAGQ